MEIGMGHVEVYCIPVPRPTHPDAWIWIVQVPILDAGMIKLSNYQGEIGGVCEWCFRIYSIP